MQSEPLPIKRTVKNYKVFPAGSQCTASRFYMATDNAYCSIKVSTRRLRWKIAPQTLVIGKKILSNPITRAYNRAYKTHNARIRYGTMTRAEFQTWVAKAKQLRDACQSGEISLDRFEKWLKQ